jgi:hypothetical protein
VSDRFFDFVGKTTRTRPWECSFKATVVSDIEGENYRNIEYIAQQQESRISRSVEQRSRDSMSKCGVPETPNLIGGGHLQRTDKLEAGFIRRWVFSGCRARPTCGSSCCHRFSSFRLCSQPALRSLCCRQHAAYRLYPLMLLMRLL